MATAEFVQTEPRFLLHGVPWREYTALRELPENRHVRMTYDRGDLEMMSPSKWHEQLSYLIGRLIDAWTEELGIDVQSCRTVTFRREDLQRGLEPDNCYYIAHEPQVRRKKELDLSLDPPPDLAVEIDVTASAIEKMPVYEAYGVPELWRFDGEALQIHVLGADGRYASRQASVAFPQLPPAEIARVLQQLGTASDTTLVRSFRKWVRTVITPGLQ
jgi:Uma2 family endonuclease